MTEQAGVLTRIKRWFRRGPTDGPLHLEINPIDSSIQPAERPRASIFRPWARREAAFTAIQQSFETLTGLMGAIRESMDKQSRNQEQLLQSLQSLPQVMQTIPDGQKVQTETLRMIVGQMEQQNAHQLRLTDILDKVSDAQTGQKSLLAAMGDRVETLSGHDQAISDNLRSLGSAMQTASRHSENSAQVLDQMRQQLASQSGELERVLGRQNTRFTTMLAIAIFLAVAALVAVTVIGYLLLTRVR